MNSKKTRQIVLSGLFLAIALIIPNLFGNFPIVLKRFSPMHLPVMLCGFVCGWPYGLVVGFIAPLLRSAIFGVPVLIPTGISMAFELATYGLVTGFLYAKFPKKAAYIYVALIIAMLCGRTVMGLVDVPLYGLAGQEFGLEVFWSIAFINAIPAIVLQLIIVPVLVLALRKAKLMD